MMLVNQIAGFFKTYYLKSEVNNEVYFWHGDEYWSFVQVLDVHSQAYPKYHNKKITYLCNISRKNVGDEVDFLPADEPKSFLQFYSITLVVHSRACSSTRNNEVTIFLQYLKEYVKDSKLIFCLQINIKGSSF